MSPVQPVWLLPSIVNILLLLKGEGHSYSEKEYSFRSFRMATALAVEILVKGRKGERSERLRRQWTYELFQERLSPRGSLTLRGKRNNTKRIQTAGSLEKGSV